MRKRRRVNKRKLLLLIGIIVIILIACICFFNNKAKINIIKDTLEINSVYSTKDLVSGQNILLKDNEYSFDKLGDNQLTIKYLKGNNEKEKIINIKVVDTTKPELELKTTSITLVVGDKDTLLDNVTAKDNSNEEITVLIEGDYDLKKAGTYNLKYVATDSSGNKAQEDFTLTVNEKKTAQTVSTSSSEYYVKVNKTLNVAMVYKLDSNKEYTNLVKTFLVSTGGENTPNGVFTTTDRYETLSLVNGVWGHYTLRITGPIWFHSVPYFSKPNNGHWDNLEYEEYNKLGTTASLGCVRLAAKDAKWIFDNLPWHTKVEIYESDKLPDGVVKPSFSKIDTSSKNRGWDPTDPDPANPWNL